MSAITSLFSGPKIPVLPAPPDNRMAADVADRERRKLIAGQTKTVFTGGQGLIGAGNKRPTLGGTPA